MDAAAPEGAGGTLCVLMSAARDLADADYAELTGAERAECLLGLEQLDAAVTVARSRVLRVFEGQQDYELDGQRSPAAWLVNMSKVTKAEAAAYRAWVTVVAGHPLVAAAMRDGVLSKSWVRKICTLTGKIPAEFRGEAETIIVAAARTGASLRDLVYLAAEILARTVGADEDEEKPFRDRGLRLQVTLDGAGVLSGELSPECAAAVQAVLGELSKRRGREDRRSHGERMHDGLQDAMLRLLGSNLVPEKNGHPVTAIVHIGLADAIALDDGSELQRQWTARLAARWAGHRAADAVQPGDGGAWICGPAAKGIVCDAALFPIVTGEVDIGPLDDLVRLCVQLDAYRHGEPGSGASAGPGSGPGGADGADGAGAGPGRGAHAARMQELMEQIIGKCVAILSGEPGLAGFLRRNLLGQAGLGGPSLPLDVGDVDHIPWWIRRAVHTRDQTCRWPNGCDQPAAGCQPHHLVRRADRGATKIGNLNDFCLFHHIIAIHRWGWKVTVKGDGTLEAVSPDGRVYKDHSRPPPPRPG